MVYLIYLFTKWMNSSRSREIINWVEKLSQTSNIFFITHGWTKTTVDLTSKWVKKSMIMIKSPQIFSFGYSFPTRLPFVHWHGGWGWVGFQTLSYWGTLGLWCVASSYTKKNKLQNLMKIWIEVKYPVLQDKHAECMCLFKKKSWWINSMDFQLHFTKIKSNAERKLKTKF